MSLGSLFMGGENKAGASTAGMFGIGGDLNLGQILTTSNMLMGAFGGGVSQGSAPQTEIPLTPEGKKLQTSLWDTVKKQHDEGLMPPNLVSLEVGKLKETMQTTKRRTGTSQFMSRSQGDGPGVGTGRALMGGMLGKTQSISDAVDVADLPFELRATEKRDSLKGLQNMMNIEKQTPVLHAQSSLQQSLNKAGARSVQGAAIGDMAKYMAMLKYPAY